MRLFDDDQVGCYLDAIDHRVETTSERETKMVDLTLRVQPFTPELAVSFDPDVRALLFSLSGAEPKPKIKEVKLTITVPRQMLAIYALPEAEQGLVLTDCEISGCRVRTEKGVDGFALIFYVSYGPPSPDELEYVCAWHTTQRFITFHPQAPALDFGKHPTPETPKPPRRPRRASVPDDHARPHVEH